jgi:carbon starvation protein
VAGLGLGVTTSSGTLTGEAAFAASYADWGTASTGAIGAFVQGSGNFLRALHLPEAFAVALMGVFVASFAATTMDTACRLQRYVTQELASTLGLRMFEGKHASTLLAITLAAVIAAMPAPGASWEFANLGKGGLFLWPIFGATNQLLGGIAFLVILFWMSRRKLPLMFVAIPAVFMLVLPAVAMVSQLFYGPTAWITGDKPNFLLAAVAVVTLVLEVWIIVEAIKAWPRAKGVLEE